MIKLETCLYQLVWHLSPKSPQALLQCPIIACFAKQIVNNLKIMHFQLYKNRETSQILKHTYIVVFCLFLNELMTPGVFFLPLKKCRTDEPLSPPNKVFASSQVSPTNSSTATALRGPAQRNRAWQFTQDTWYYLQTNKLTLGCKKYEFIYIKPTC